MCILALLFLAFYMLHTLHTHIRDNVAFLSGMVNAHNQFLRKTERERLRDLEGDIMIKMGN
jgi:hypothetical protein